jgi:uncharacterized cofD-like protein
MTSFVGPRVVAIGGGHGLAMLLKAVRSYAGHTTAIVATGDDGGSSGRLRECIDMPAPGDLRRCIAAVSPNRELAEAMEHRFTDGELAGHAVGNLVLAGLVDAGHDLVGAADHLSRWLGVDPDFMQVLPSTDSPIDLVAETPEGIVRGQVEIEAAGRLVHIAVDPPDPPVPAAATEALHHADQIVLGPGSFYTSVLAPAVVPGIQRGIAERTGRFVFVANLQADETGVKNVDLAGHLTVLGLHGLTPDVVVTQRGALALGDVKGAAPGVEVIEADVDRPHGLAHDSDLLGAVLAELVS